MIYNFIRSSLEVHTSLMIFEINQTHISLHQCFGTGIIFDHLTICKCLAHSSGHSYHNFFSFFIISSDFNGVNLVILQLLR